MSISEEEIAEAFKNERRILSTLPNHKNVVKMVDFYENEYKAYLVLERAGTTTL